MTCLHSSDVCHTWLLSCGRLESDQERYNREQNVRVINNAKNLKQQHSWCRPRETK